MDSSKSLLTGLVLISCAFIFQLIGLASPYWISLEFTGIKAHSGLWKSCATLKLLDIDECTDYGMHVPEWLKVVRATSIMGFISLLVALVMTIMKLFFLKDLKPTLFAAIYTAFIGALCILISITVFAAKKGNLNTSPLEIQYHFAFVFCILAMLAAGGAGSVMVVDAA